MPEMHAIEISDRVDGSFEPGRRARRVRRDHEAVSHCIMPILGLQAPGALAGGKLPRAPDTVKRLHVSLSGREER